MQERAESFRKNLSNVEDDKLFDSVTDFAQKVAVDFENDFPGRSNFEYVNNPLWQIMLGSSLPENHKEETSPEVQEWLERKVADFLDTI